MSALLLVCCSKFIWHLQDRLHEAVSSLNAKAAAPASPEKNKLANQLRAELEVHKDALAASKQEIAALADSLDKASSMIEVSL